MQEEIRLNNIDETRNYLLNKIELNDLMSGRQTKVCRALNYFEHFLFFISAISGCVSISTFTSLIGFSVGIASSATGLAYSVINEGIKQRNSIIK